MTLLTRAWRSACMDYCFDVTPFTKEERVLVLSRQGRRQISLFAALRKLVVTSQESSQQRRAFITRIKLNVYTLLYNDFLITIFKCKKKK